MESFTEYSKGLPLSQEIYYKLNPPPKTHEEWAMKFNVIGDITEIVNKFKIVRKNIGDENNSNL